MFSGNLNPYIPKFILLIALLIACMAAFSQTNLRCDCLSGDSTFSHLIDSQLVRLKRGLPDSSLNNIRRYRLPDKSAPSVKLSRPFVSNNFLTISSSYISRIEGVHGYRDILQHQLNYSTTATPLKGVPVKVSVYGRYSNTPIFRNFLNFSVDLQPNLIGKKAGDELASETREKMNELGEKLVRYFNERMRQMAELDALVQRFGLDSCINAYIHAKDILSNQNTYIDKIAQGADSVASAEKYVQQYERFSRKMDSARLFKDSVVNEITNARNELEKYIGARAVGKPDFAAFQQALSPHLQRVDSTREAVEPVRSSFLSGFTQLSIGRSFSSGTQLSMQDISINGLNAAYQFGKVFSVVQVGFTDLGLRDFAFNISQARINNPVYAGGVGLGKREASFLLLSAFGGKRNSGALPVENGAQSTVFGLSLSGRLKIGPLSLSGEVAQSSQASSRGRVIADQAKTGAGGLNNKAFSVMVSGAVPRTGIFIDGFYKYYGIDYYGFNAFRVNANNKQWGIAADKSFFSGMVKFVGAIKTNDYTNPYVEQLFDGKNVLTTANVIFRKNRWVASGGYVPSRQYFVMKDVVYENNYQTFSLFSSYSCKLGDIPLVSSVSYSHFYSQPSDKTFFYGNASNFSTGYSLSFSRFTPAFNASMMMNDVYKYIVFDGGGQYEVSPKLSLKLGFKVNSLSAGDYQSKTGLYGGTSFALMKNWMFSIQMDNNFFPDMNYNLYGSNMGVLTISTSF